MSTEAACPTNSTLSVMNVSLLIVVLSVSTIAFGQDHSKSEQLAGNRYVKARLALEKSSLVPGKTSHLAVIFDISPGWHIYWRNPGDSGLAPKVDFKLPAGVTVDSPQWPAPTRRVEAGRIIDYVYERQLVLIFPITFSDKTSAKEIALSAEVDWLVCRERCVPGKATINARFPVAAEAKPSRDAPLFAAARLRHPQSLAATPPYEARWERNKIVITVRGASHLTFLPLENNEDIYPIDLALHGDVTSDTLQLEYPAEVTTLKAVEAVLTVTRQGNEAYYQLKLPPPTH